MSMASSSSSSSPLSSLYDHEKINLDSIRVLVSMIGKYIGDLLSDTETWDSLKLKCSSQLLMQKQDSFEFSEHSVLSNLYWGMEGIESAIQAKGSEEKAFQLRNSEKMLQVPALQDENGIIAGIPAHLLVAYSYFYLSMVRQLQGDWWQAALHFLQALMVSPRLLRTEIAPELCEYIFPSFLMSESLETCAESVTIKNISEDISSESVRQIARRYKHCLTYYHVMLYGESPQLQSEREYAPLQPFQSQPFRHGISKASESFKSDEHGQTSQTCCKFQKVHPVDFQEDETDPIIGLARTAGDIRKIQDQDVLKHCGVNTRPYTSVRCLQDMLQESQSDTPSTVDSCYSVSFGNDFMANTEGTKSSSMSTDRQHYIKNQFDSSSSFCNTNQAYMEENEVYITKCLSQRSLSSMDDLKLSNMKFRDEERDAQWNVYMEDTTTQRTTEPHEVQDFEQITLTKLKNHLSAERDTQVIATKEACNSNSQRKWSKLCLQSDKDFKSELLTRLEGVISELRFSEKLVKYDEDYATEVIAIYEMMNNKNGAKYTMLKDVILDQLLAGISTSKDETAIRASVSILSTIISANRSVIEDVKNKGLQLSDLAKALKQNVHEAATLIFLIKPSPAEIKSLELLPALVEVVCTSNIYKCKPPSILLTPPVASLKIIEVLVTAFDQATNNMNLAAINSPRVLCGFLNVAKITNVEEFMSLASILVKCMRFGGQSRQDLSQLIPVAPFISLLESNVDHSKYLALEFFHEILCIPRSSAVSLLQRIRREGSMDIIMHTLNLCVQQLKSEYQLLAANILLQLDALENASSKSVFRDKAAHALLNSVTSEEGSAEQLVSASILANLGGTYSWTGEPYTVAWLVKKAGLTDLSHRNMIRHVDWLEQFLQDAGINRWCSKIAKSIIEIGEPAFHALEKGLKSRIKRVSKDSLTAIAWLSFEITKSPDSIRHAACEILLSGIQQFLHPGLDLEERLLACLCIYNYVSGKGMQKLIHFSEGVRESLRRFSNVTWMAEELHKVGDYYLPNKSRISCVHTQILEMRQSGSGAVNALIYYKGLLCSGFSDGSIKVWDIKGPTATLLWDIKEHKKAITCFSLFEPGESLLSGSSDKTIRVWQMVQRKLICIEVMETKDPIRKLDTYGKMILAITHSHKIKIFNSSKTFMDICKGKSVKCMKAVQGKIYLGCKDSSIQELSVTNNRKREIRTAKRSWMFQTKPITSIVAYKDWIYSSTSTVEGSDIKEWRKHGEAQVSISAEKGRTIRTMGVVEDFVYLNRSSSSSSIEIWLRRTQQKVGRISTGSKITSLLTANDVILCGTETGLIKGWIPL